MGPYLGDFVEDSVVRHKWDTNDGDGASITRTVNGVIKVYKDDSTDEVTAPTGITDTEDFDGLVGVHHCIIDTNANVYYAKGSDYSVVLTASTIDGQVVNAELFSFSIENRSVDLTHIMGTILSEGGAGQLSAAFIKLFDVAAPLLVASDPMVGTNNANTVVPDVGGTAAGLHSTTDGKIDALVTPDVAGTAATLHGVTDGKIDALVTPDAAGIAAALHGVTDGKITALNNVTAGQVVTAILTATIDGSLGMQETLTVLLALMTAKQVDKVGNTYIFKDQDGNTKVTITYGAATTTAVIS